MTYERRIENGVELSNTLWQLNRYKLLDYIEKKTNTPVPEDCYELISVAFRCGGVAMLTAIGGKRHEVHSED